MDAPVPLCDLAKQQGDPIAMREREILDTPVYDAGSSDDEKVIVVFTDRDSANNLSISRDVYGESAT